MTQPSHATQPRSSRTATGWAFAVLAGVLLAFTPLLSTDPAIGQETDPEAAESGYQSVEPSIEQARANILIARQLQFTHFKDLSIDDSMSGDVLDAYLDQLDSQRLYFLKKDIDRFEQWRGDMDAAIKTGQLEPAFEIYNQFQKRLVERLEYALSLVRGGFDTLSFDKDDRLMLDRSEENWATNQEALDTIWRKRVKNAILAQRLNGKDDEDITESLVQRYENQLSRARQVRSEDAFQSYMNAFAGLWDPHTSYFSPRTSENFNINMSLSLEGIGAVLKSENEYTEVVRLVPGGPADKQGQLQPGDRIVGVGQEEEGVDNVISWRLGDVVDQIRGPRGSTVRLRVIPASAADETVTRTIAITRDKVKLEEQSAQSNVIEMDRGDQTHRVGVVDIPTFYADFKAMQAGDPNYKSTTRDVRKLLEKMQKEQSLDGLVIDLRDNGGGALQEANDLVGLFIEQGPTVQVRNADNEVKVLRDQDSSVTYDGPLVVLVNRMSASASEIFAGAIQDYGRGLVVGSQTFGKGTVQAVRPLNHGQLKITQSKFYRVSGGSTQHRGVIPDITIPTRIDKTEIGEDALDGALPWDQIEAVPHTRYYDFSGMIGELRKRHEKRFETTPEFQLLQKEIELLRQKRERNYVSLQTEERRSYQQSMESRQLEIANARRQLKDKAPFENWEAVRDHREEEAAAPDNETEMDFIIRESGNIMADMLEMNRQMASIVEPEAVAAKTNP